MDRFREKRDQIGASSMPPLFFRTVLVHPDCESGGPGFRAMCRSDTSTQPPLRRGSFVSEIRAEILVHRCPQARFIQSSRSCPPTRAPSGIPSCRSSGPVYTPIA